MLDGRQKHFDIGDGGTGSAIAQCLVSVALVVAGAVVAASSFGAASVVAGGLISAGVSGATTTITNCVQGKPASWKEWGESTAIGAVTGLVGGALCAGVGGLAQGSRRASRWLRGRRSRPRASEWWLAPPFRP